MKAGSSGVVRRAWLYAGLSFAVYQANLRPVASWDSVPAALVPFTLYLDSSVRMDRYGPWFREKVHRRPYFLYSEKGRDYSAYPVALPLLLYPAYLPVLATLGVERWETGEQVVAARILEKLFAATLAAASVGVFYAVAQGLAGAVAGPLTLLFAFATTAWATLSQALWQHTGGVLLLLLSFWWLTAGRERSPAGWAAGLCAAAAVAVRPTNLLFAFAWAAVMRNEGSWRRAAFLVPAALAAAGTAVLNHSIYGDVRGVQSQGLDWRFFPGLAGELASPARGLLIYCPFFAFLPWGLRQGWRHGWYRVCVVYSTAHLGLIAVWPLWWGGTCWGPRLLSEVMPFLVLMLAPVLEGAGGWRKYGLVLLASWAAFLQFTGAFFYPRGYWDDRPGGAAGEARYWDWRDNPIRRTLAAGMATEPYRVVWEGVRHGPAAAVRKMNELNMRGL